eukprot:4824825-Pyramimonas_sp.AAC.1
MEQRQAVVDGAHAAWLRAARLHFGGVVDAAPQDLAYWGGGLSFVDKPLDAVLATPKNTRARASTGKHGHALAERSAAHTGRPDCCFA